MFSGEFGIVYKAHLIVDVNGMPELVAVKTMKRKLHCHDKGAIKNHAQITPCIYIYIYMLMSTQGECRTIGIIGMHPMKIIGTYIHSDKHLANTGNHYTRIGTMNIGIIIL